MFGSTLGLEDGDEYTVLGLSIFMRLLLAKSLIAS